MRLNMDDGFIHVTLSERNLRTLLIKLQQDGSARTLIDGDCTFAVTAEHDAAHYVGRRPGPMHPDTERFLPPRPEMSE